jgi:hypothetical protein
MKSVILLYCRIMTLRSLTAFFLFTISWVQADVPLPPNVLNPATTAEAWNVIRLTRANVVKLLEEKRIVEVPEQIALCSPALRLLAHASVKADQKSWMDEQTSRAFSAVNSVAQCCMVGSQPDAEKAFVDLQSALTKLESVFTSAEVGAEIYSCANHPELPSTTSGSLCPKCQTPLRIRRIPYSFIYTTPSTPTITLNLTPRGPLIAGQEITVDMKLETLAAKSVSVSDLLVVHTQPINLYILDPALSTFQTVQPTPKKEAGGYVFSFTPKVDGACRIWADIVPVATGLQELPHVDIGGKYVPEVPQDLADVVTVTADGYTFELSFAGDMSGQLSAKKTQLLRIKVTDSAGRPVEHLEPVMGAFAQVVGFYTDHETVLRLHPVGGDILREDLRGGPHVGFKIYAPKSGLIRLYCQLRIEGKMLTVPFSVNVGR